MSSHLTKDRSPVMSSSWTCDTIVSRALGSRTTRAKWSIRDVSCAGFSQASSSIHHPHIPFYLLYRLRDTSIQSFLFLDSVHVVSILCKWLLNISCGTRNFYTSYLCVGVELSASCSFTSSLHHFRGLSGRVIQLEIIRSSILNSPLCNDFSLCQLCWSFWRY